MKFYYSQITTLFLLWLLTATEGIAQFSIGTWRDHLPYKECIDLCQAGNIIYVATPYSLFTYDPNSGEIEKITKATKLTDVGVTAIEYDPQSGLVVVGYSNGNLDLISETNSYNIPDIKISSIIGDKAIYDILPYGDRVYLSTGFGVVVIDMLRREVKESYFIGENGGPVRVNDIAIYQGSIYVATETGLQTASVTNPFLANFQNWNAVIDLPGDSVVQHIEFFDDEMVLSIPGTVSDTLWRRSMPDGNWQIQSQLSQFRINQLWSDDEWFTVSGNYGFLVNHFDFGFTLENTLLAGSLIQPRNCIVDQYGQFWTADRFNALMVRRNPDGSSDDIIIPDGPASGSSRRISAYNNNVWVAHGGVRPDWGNLYRIDGFSGYVEDRWITIPADTMAHAGNHFNAFNPFVIDIMDVAVDPLNNGRIMAGSWEEGLLEINATNQSVRPVNGSASTGPDGSGFDWAPGWTGVSGVAFDENGILWCTNSYTNHAIHAYDRNNNFYDFDFSPAVGNTDEVVDIMVARNKLIWANVNGRGLLVLNYNETLDQYTDDNYKLLTETEGNGKLPSNDVLCMEEDLDGEVWVGTASGLSIFYNPDAIFSDENFDSEQILIEQDGNTQILLQTETINCIEIDGSNRKWIGTQNSGVYLFSDDGLTQIYHFTEENSPLFSNTVYDIAINHSNGEVYFATEDGIVGFFSTATNFDPEMSNVRVFPNPVRPDYFGNITIDGLAYNTSVKVTDIQGNIVFETESEGGRAVWNGLRADGQRPATGVYLVFVTTPDGSADEVRKLTFIR